MASDLIRTLKSQTDPRRWAGESLCVHPFLRQSRPKVAKNFQAGVLVAFYQAEIGKVSPPAVTWRTKEGFAAEPALISGGRRGEELESARGIADAKPFA